MSAIGQSRMHIRAYRAPKQALLPPTEQAAQILKTWGCTVDGAARGLDDLSGRGMLGNKDGRDYVRAVTAALKDAGFDVWGNT